MQDQYIYGRLPILEALESGHAVEKIFFQKGIQGENIGDILRQAKAQDVPLSYVPPQKLKKYGSVNHQGAVAIISQVEYLDIQDIIDQIYANAETPFLVVLEGITDTRNIGAIARSAYALGAQAMIREIKNSAPINADVVKTSAGAALQIHWAKEKNIRIICDKLKLNGIRILASDLNKDADALENLELTEPLAIVLGSEDEGISPFIREVADQTYRIPMQHEFDSLNVSVAAGISFYAINQKRMQK